MNFSEFEIEKEDINDNVQDVVAVKDFVNYVKAFQFRTFSHYREDYLEDKRQINELQFII